MGPPVPAVTSARPSAVQGFRVVADPAELLAAMLRDHPEAWVGAIDRDARYVPVPPSVPVGAHRRLEGGWILDHVAVGARAPLSGAWRAALESGHTVHEVQLAGGHTAVFHLFMLAATHGADIVVVVADDGVDFSVAPAVRDIQSSSRFSRTLRDQSGRTIEIDEAAPEVLGWSAEHLLNRTPPLERVHPDDQHAAIEGWMATLADPSTGRRTRLRLLRSDGTYRWFEMTNFNQLDDPDRPGVVTEFLDISEEMAAHEAVRAREQLLHRLAETLPLGVLQLAPDGAIVYKNDYLADIIGEEGAVDMAEQFTQTVDEDRPLLERAFTTALVDGADDDVVVRMTPRGADTERLVRVITKTLLAENGDVTGVIACISDVTETERMGRELERRATFDALTGCLNRATVLARLEAALAGDGEGCAAIFLDLDGFKSVNDRGGHAVGDEMLRAAARVLDDTTRDGDAVGRLGGDEFLVVATELRSATEAMELAGRIADAMRAHPTVLGSHVPLQASIGVAWAAPRSVSAHDLVERADAAMYTSKRESAGFPHLWQTGSRGTRSA